MTRFKTVLLGSAVAAAFAATALAQPVPSPVPAGAAEQNGLEAGHELNS